MTQRKYIIRLFTLLVIISQPFHVHGFPFTDPDAPVDGGIGALLLAGGVLGYKTLRKSREV